MRVLLLWENAEYRYAKQRTVALELVQNLQAVTHSEVGVAGESFRLTALNDLPTGCSLKRSEENIPR